MALELQGQNKIPFVCRGVMAEKSREHPIPWDHGGPPAALDSSPTTQPLTAPSASQGMLLGEDFFQI